jgi:peptidoglycan/LPS O-acetylase OafA/YrhL
MTDSLQALNTLPEAASRPEPKPTPVKKRGVRADIQGLRAFAVVVVILHYLTGWPAGGFVGVDIFFVISGFLITGLLVREYERTDKISFLGFYRRRARRIIPVATLVLLTTVIAARALLPDDRATAVRGDAIWAFIFGGNWHMEAVGTDYFQKGLPPSPLQHFWSLSVEEQFYFVWPWVMLALVMLAAKIGWSKLARRNVIIGFFIVSTVASFVWSMHQTAAAPTDAYFNTASRAWELGVGAILAGIAPLLGRVPNLIRTPVTVLGLAGLVVSVLIVPETGGFPAPWALLPVIAAAAVLAMGTNVQGQPATGMALREALLLPLTNRVAIYLGDVSYSLYLWHFPLAVLLLAFFEKGSIVYTGTALIGTIALSVLSYHLVEVPIRNSRWLEPGKPVAQGMPSIGFVWIAGQYVPVGIGKDAKVVKDRAPVSRGLIAGLVACALVAIVGGVAGMNATKGAAASAAASAAYFPSTTHVAGVCTGADFMPAAQQKCTNPPLTVLTPSVNRFAEDTGPEYASCWREEKAEQKICHYGSTKKDAIRVAVVGDSRGGSLAPAINDPKMLRSLNWSVDLMTGYGCQWKTSHQLTGCDKAMTEDMARFEKDPYDIIITSSARWALKDENDEYTADEYKAAWRQVTRLGTEVLVVGDNPLISDQAIACFNRVSFKINSTQCGDSRAEALAQSDPLVLAANATYQPKVHLIDMTDLYCTADFCPSVVGGMPVYRDSVGHTTATYMRTLRPYLFEKFKTALAN